MSEPKKLTGVARLVRILEDGWTIFAPDGADHALIVIDNRADEPIPLADLLAARDVVTYRPDVFRGQTGLIFDLWPRREAEVRLRFKSKDEKDYFLSQLSDGWGENVVHIEWDWRHGVKLTEARTIDVINTDDYRPERRETY
jgi:hypothetical protein